jgi:hypothetical protein
MRAMQIATGASRHLVIPITKMIEWSSLVSETRIPGETEPSQRARGRESAHGIAAHLRKVGRVAGTNVLLVLPSTQTALSTADVLAARLVATLI